MNADLQSIRSKVLESPNLGEVLREVSLSLCDLLEADRITIYAASDDGRALEAVFQKGLGSFQNLKLPAKPDLSVAGYVATHRRLVNIRDAYDEKELAAFDPPATFLQAVDARTGYRTRQLLSAPIVDAAAGSLYGVVQLLNRRDDQPFPKPCEEAIAEFCNSLAIAYRRREQQIARKRRIEELKEQAEQGLHEDAQEPYASARERLLQKFRALYARNSRLDLELEGQEAGLAWGSGDLDGLEWLCRLAACGHVGGERLLDHVLDEEYGSLRGRANLASPELGRMQALGKKYSKVAQFLSRVECSHENPDLDKLVMWLEHGGAEHAGIGAAVRELYRWPRASELNLLRDIVRSPKRSKPDPGATRIWQSNLLFQVARSRAMYATSPEARMDAIHLMERAAELGSMPAKELLWLERYEIAQDKNAYLRDWLATQPEPESASERQCMIAGMALERGVAGSPPDPQRALKWYAGALNRIEAAAVAAMAMSGYLKRYASALSRIEGRKREASARHADLFREVANLLDPDAQRNRPKSENWPADAVLAMAWYERGLALGDVDCLERWLKLLLDGKSGQALDHDVVRVRVMQFLARSEELKFLSEGAARQLFWLADRFLDGRGLNADPELAARLLEASASCGNASARNRLGQLHAEGRGVERDAQAARAWFEQAAAQGHPGARAALVEAGFAPPAPPARTQAEAANGGSGPGGEALAMEFWRAIKDGSDPDDFALYLEQFPRGTYAELARKKLEAIRKR